MNKRQPEQQAPPLQRLRVRYAKRGRARFTSHRDFARAFERALRRAGVPMAFSSGFTPHPRISYANAVPTGVATEAEYLEIGVSERCDPTRLEQGLNSALPDGLDILEVVEAASDTLADHLTASTWRIEMRATDAWPEGGLDDAVRRFLAADSFVLERMTKKGLREFDARAATMRLGVTEPGTVEVVVRHEVPQVRPDDVVRALADLAGIEVDVATVRLTRVAQGVWDGSVMVDPLNSSRAR